MAFTIHPQDQFNQVLLSNVHPLDYQNPKPSGCYNIVVIGAGTAGLVTAAGTAGLGGKVALIEHNLLGGDCLNVGCVPSKALLRSARNAYEVSTAGDYGTQIESFNVDFSKVMERMRRLRSEISPHDSVERFSGLGIDVFLGDAKFTSTNSIEVAGETLHFNKAAICTGARAFVPPVPGLREADPLTNETIFNLTEKPNRLLVLGGGPIGCEMAQAMARFGVEVTIVEMSNQLLANDDPDAANILQSQFEREGIQVLLNHQLVKVDVDGETRKVSIQHDGTAKPMEFDQILVAAGRAPNVNGLNLEIAEVNYDEKTGIVVNDYLQTTNKHIYAAGDCCMKSKFTHAADAAARLVIRNALLPVPKGKLSDISIPWCTYTDPEVAHVGISEHDAKEQGIAIDTYNKEFADVDRAILEGDTTGFVKIHTAKGKDKILGGTIVCREAGDLIGELNVALSGKIGLGKLASIIHPYPTKAEALKQVGDLYNRTRLTPMMKGIFEKWFRWTR